MTTTASSKWTLGDRVLHPTKPEWGVGHVAAASPTLHEGQPCQTLKVRFERAGVKNMNTGVVPLQAADEHPAIAPDGGQAMPDWLESHDQARIQDVMTKLPESATDPFGNAAGRLRGTLALYRFGSGGGALIDWAAAQSGLGDPLSKFSRHDLELFYERFCHARDQHLDKVVRDARNLDAAELQAIAADAPNSARDALRRLQRRR